MAGSAFFRFVGKPQMMAAIRAIEKKFPDRVAGALYRRANGVITRSKREFVPVQYGNLRASGHVEKPERDGRNIRVPLVYGGAAIPYAVAVHEHLSVHSPPSWVAKEARGEHVQFHPEGHGPKYLERPLMEAQATLAEDLAADINLESGGAGPVAVAEQE